MNQRQNGCTKPIRRRAVIVGIASALAAGLHTVQAQQNPMRRIGVLMNVAEEDPESKLLVAAFEQGLAEFGRIAGRNMQIDYRWTGGDAQRIRRYAAELVALKPDVILASGGTHVGPLQALTSSVPIVFVLVADPVAAGFVASLARPGGNATGFTVFDYSIGGKWLELLKQIAPDMTRVAVLRDPTNPSGTGLFGAIQTAAPSFGVGVSPIGLRDAGEIERGIAAFARGAKGGLIVTPTSLAIVHRDLIIAQASRYRLPAVYPFRYFVTGGGLMYYGVDPADEYRQAARYVDRILKGEKPADLPVQAPTKYQLIINLKTAKPLGLTVPSTLLVSASEVIQ